MVRMFLQRFGSKTDIYLEERTERDELNHPIEEFEKAGTEYVLQHFDSAIDEERDYDSGRLVKETPTFIFAEGTIAENNCHIIYQGREYEITAMTFRGNHYQSDGKYRAEGSLLDEENGE